MDYLKVYRDGAYVGDIGDPYYLPDFVLNNYGDEDLARFSLDVAEVRVYKEREITKAAADWAHNTVGLMAAVFAVTKHYTGEPMSAAEQADYGALRDNRAHKDGLIAQVNAEVDWQTARDAYVWAPV